MHTKKPHSQDPEERKGLFRRLLSGRRAVMFDFDGVIADSEYYHFLAYREVFLRLHGHTLNPEEYWIHWSSKGEGIPGEVRRHGLRGVDPEVIKEERDLIFFEHCRAGHISLFEGAVDLMKSVEAQGFKTAIASNSRREWIEAILETNGVAYRPPFMIGKTPDVKPKPAPDIFVKAAREMEEDPESCLVFEDAEKGLEAAHAAGITCIIIRNNLNRGIAFSDADLVVPSHEELLSFFS